MTCSQCGKEIDDVACSCSKPEESTLTTTSEIDDAGQTPPSPAAPPHYWDDFYEKHKPKPVEIDIENKMVLGKVLTLSKATRVWLWVLVYFYGIYATFGFLRFFLLEEKFNLITLLIIVLICVELVLMLKGEKIGWQIYVKTMVVLMYRTIGSLVLVLLSLGLFAHVLWVFPYIEVIVYLLHAGTRGLAVHIFMIGAPALVTWFLVHRDSRGVEDSMR